MRPALFQDFEKKAGPMKWTTEAEAALQDLKRYLSSTPTLVAPKPQEPLLLYLAATNQVVSVVLVAQREVDGEVATAARLLNGELGCSVGVEQLQGVDEAIEEHGQSGARGHPVVRRILEVRQAHGG